MHVRLESATSATLLALKDLTLNKIRNKVATSATVLMIKDLGMTFFVSRETRISSSLIVKDLGQKRWPRLTGELRNHIEHKDHRDGTPTARTQGPKKTGLTGFTG